MYYDLESENIITYEQNKYSFFIDATVDAPTSNGILMYVWENDVYSQKTDEKIENITVTAKQEEEIPVVE